MSEQVEKYFEPEKAEKCVFCGKPIEPNSYDYDGALINKNADICSVSRILSAFYLDNHVLDVDDEENNSERGYFHGKCFDEQVKNVKDHVDNNFTYTVERQALYKERDALKDRLARISALGKRPATNDVNAALKTIGDAILIAREGESGTDQHYFVQRWRKYPDEKPQGQEKLNIIAKIDATHYIDNVFYESEEHIASDPGSVWHDITEWFSLSGIGTEGYPDFYNHESKNTTFCKIPANNCGHCQYIVEDCIDAYRKKMARDATKASNQ